MSWLRIPSDVDDARPGEIRALRDFLIVSWSDAIREHAIADQDWTEAELTSALRLLRAKVLAMSPAELLFILRSTSPAGPDDRVH